MLKCINEVLGEYLKGKMTEEECIFNITIINNNNNNVLNNILSNHDSNKISHIECINELLKATDDKKSHHKYNDYIASIDARKCMDCGNMGIQVEVEDKATESVLWKGCTKCGKSYHIKTVKKEVRVENISERNIEDDKKMIEIAKGDCSVQVDDIAEYYLHKYEEVIKRKKSPGDDVVIKYNDIINVLAELNKVINSCTNGHGNGYLWRALSGIDAQLMDMIGDDKGTIVNAVIKKMSSK